MLVTTITWRRALAFPLVLLALVSFQARAATSDGASTGPSARPAHHAHGTSAEPRLRSASALVLDTTHSTVLYSHHADQAMPIASISKLLTALVVADAGLDLDERLTITREDCAVGRGAYSRLTVGTTLTRGDLIHLALMSSENRAAHALGRNYPGGVPAFVDAMNAKAHALGMTSAHFVEPTGLSSENVASAEDLSRLVAAAAGNDVIRQYSTDPGYAVRVGRHMVQFRNTDSLVSNPAWDIVVQKTGYITEAGRCLVMQAVIESRTVVIVLLNSFGKNTRVADARRIRRWMEATLTHATTTADTKSASTETAL
jgi:serine-type D-Ala-D-Ala endopeptidase (penicillin-binding protein 7)